MGAPGGGALQRAEGLIPGRNAGVPNMLRFQCQPVHLHSSNHAFQADVIAPSLLTSAYPLLNVKFKNACHQYSAICSEHSLPAIQGLLAGLAWLAKTYAGPSIILIGTSPDRRLFFGR